MIRMYNRVSQVLMEFEVLYHNAWVNSVEAVSEGECYIYRLHFCCQSVHNIT